MIPLSITIPYHQNPDYLKEALDSVARQTLLPAQVIVVDNSENGEAEAMLKHVPCDTRHIRSASAQYLAAYFNQCLESVQTPWCTILHADDRLLPCYVEVMSEALERYPDAAGLFCKTQAIDRYGRRCFSFKDWAKQYFWPGSSPEIRMRGENGLAALLRANFIMCPTVCYNLPVLRDRRFDPAWEVMLDMDLYGRLLLDDETLIGIRQTLYACRRHPAATTSVNERDFSMFQEGVRCIQALAEGAARKRWYRAAGVGRRRIIHRLYVFCRSFKIKNVFLLCKNVSP